MNNTTNTNTTNTTNGTQLPEYVTSSIVNTRDKRNYSLNAFFVLYYVTVNHDPHYLSEFSTGERDDLILSLEWLAGGRERIIKVNKDKETGKDNAVDIPMNVYRKNMFTQVWNG